MDNEEILENEDEESGILTLTDENGVETDFEYLDCIPYEGKEYLLLLPADEAATDVVILRWSLWTRRRKTTFPSRTRPS